MTIKQLGGVFGRNPTFNDVDVEGSLTINGAVIPSPADILVSSDIGVTVQGYDAQTAKTDTAQTFTAKQDFAFGAGGNYVATFQNTSNGTPYNVWIKDAGTPANGYPLLVVSNSDGSSPYFRVDSGNGDISAGKNIKFLSSGLGIDFSATAGTGTSELFDDYEEGVWTPTFTGSSGNPAVTYTEQSGIYTKVGRQVTFFGTLRWSAYSGGSGTLYISGLPFTAGILSGVDWFPGTFSDSRSNTSWSGYTQLSLAVQAGQSKATINVLKDSANQFTVGHATVGASGVFKFTATYFV